MRNVSAVDCDAENLLLLLNDFLALLPSNTIVLDALDECLEDAEETGQGKEIRPHEAGRLLVYLREVALKTSSRIIMLTRSSHFSSTALVDSIQISMSETVMRRDIERFIEREIERFCVKSQSPILRAMKPEIVSTILEKCQGMFLMAKFMVDDVVRAPRVKDVRDALNDFPHELNKWYRKQYEMTNMMLSETEESAGLHPPHCLDRIRATQCQVNIGYASIEPHVAYRRRKRNAPTNE